MNLIGKYKGSTDCDIIARTLYGEARYICTRTERIAIAHVINNRVHDSKNRWGNTHKEVCLQQKQFSCWNEDDPNLDKIINVRWENEHFQECFGIAYSVVNLFVHDFTDGANHYHDKSLEEPPKWTNNMVLTLETRHFKFYRG